MKPMKEKDKTSSLKQRKHINIQKYKSITLNTADIDNDTQLLDYM